MSNSPENEENGHDDPTTSESKLCESKDSINLLSDGEIKSDVDDKQATENGLKEEEEEEAGNSHGDTIDNRDCMTDAEMKDDSDEITNSTQKDDEEGKTMEKRERRKAKSKYNNMDNEDLEKMLKWKHGIGHLPGSNLKFRKSDTGSLEVITPMSDDDDVVEYKDFSLEKEKKNRRKRGFIKTTTTKRIDVRSLSTDKGIPRVASPVKKEESPDEKKRRKERKRQKFDDDDLLKCESCGCYGLISEFRSSGRFCSQRCVGAFASKRRAEMIAEQIAAEEKPVYKPAKKSGKKRKSEIKDSSPFATRSPSVDSLAEESKLFFPDDAKLFFESAGYDEEFEWDSYLKITGTKAVPLKSFIKEYPEQELFPRSGGQFHPKMKLECIDPRHQSCITVVSIVEVHGARMRLHFDGWSENYDFWINTNSPLMFPCGWCEKEGQKLCPPRGVDADTFQWSNYLRETGCDAAPAHLFREVPKTNKKFTTNMKLEAVDRKNPDLICVASVNNVIGDQYLIHFDEWDDQYDYWCREDCPYIHEVGWCDHNSIPLVPPTDEMVNLFSWEDYLKETNCIAAPKSLFHARPQPSFDIGSKLEVIDPRNPSLLRVGTVADVEHHQIKIHFDGWDSMFDYWFDSEASDLHPVSWHKKTGYRLEPPPTGKESSDSRLCSTPGCRGVGHIKGAKYTTHHTTFGCPYTTQNINRSSSPVIDRLAPNALAEETSIINRTNNMKNGSHIEPLPDSNNKGDRSKTKIRKRKYKRREELSSSVGETENTKTSFSSTLTKPIPSTHIPAGQQALIPSAKAVPWTQDDVVAFLDGIGCAEFSPSFKDHQIDGQALLLLSQADLVRHLKLKLGPALKIYSEISKL